MRSIILAFVFLSCVSYTLADEDTVKASKLLLAAITGANPQASGVGGGTECAACTVLVAMAEQLAYIHDKPLLNVMQDFCAKLPIGVKQACDAFVNLYGDVIINLIELEETPDYVSQQLGVCTATCHLFPEPLVPPAKRDPTIDWSSRIPKRPDNWVGLELIDRSLSGFANEHLPLFDIDGDKFSDWKTLRGASWRGRDCDDLKKTVYPGRKNSTWPAEVDHNCNGIFGVNLQGESYEEILCSGTKYYGQAILGDSAAAHFHVPPEWVTPAKIANTTFDDLLPILANELDWPEMSATTGYTYNGWQGHPKGPVVSSYLKGLNNNRCTFRDYQNIGVNGARTSSMASNIMFSFARNQTLDLPINLMYALIGNDVCNPHPGFSHMTTPEEFYTNVVTAMNYLDTQLPMGSHVVFMGLADGLVLWDAMHARIHPIGELRQDVTYADLYDYLNCLEISPCWGWMNSDPFARNETQRIADQLSAVYHEVIKNNTYIHFNMTYIDCPVREIFDGWVAAGGQPWELVEPVDGFHPNQISNALIAEYVWNLFVNKYPYLIPPVNPNNEEILRLFGDQGGY